MTKERQTSFKEFLETTDSLVVSDSVSQLLEDVQLEYAVSFLEVGQLLRKYCASRFGRIHNNFFWVDRDIMALRWKSNKKPSFQTQIFFSDINRIVPGFDSDFWKIKNDEKRQYGIELLYKSYRLCFSCFDKESWKLWLAGLLYLHHQAAIKHHPKMVLINYQFEKHLSLENFGRHERVNVYELFNFLHRINYPVNPNYVNDLVKMFTKKQKDTVDYSVYRQIVKALVCHEDVTVYFNLYKNKETNTITLEGFKAFLREIQKTPDCLLDEETQTMFQLPSSLCDENGLTEFGFTIILSSDLNSIMSPSKKKINCSTMNCPLTQYWISSSHNTYLTRDQMIGKSSVGRYIDTLLKGCRCVELDCWNGSDGEPVIYHGHTLTSKIPFAAVIKACRDYAFNKSPYPVILSLEMHCSTRQKRRIGEILKEILGDSLYRHPPGAPVPSPQQLLRRFLVKGRVPNESGIESQEGNESDLLQEEEERLLECETSFPYQYCYDIPSAVLHDTVSLETPIVSSNPNPVNHDLSKPVSSDSPLVSLKEYYSTISLTGARFTSFSQQGRRKMDICSLNEKRFKRLAAMHPEDLAAFHKVHFSRVYPSGTRMMSSNFNPMKFWLFGCQMVALNFQVLDLSTLLNLGRFSEGDFCGYVLKPPIMRQPNYTFVPTVMSHPELLYLVHEVPLQITLQILAAQQLPCRFSDSRWTSKREAVCAYVTVWLQGIDKDSVVYRTNCVYNSGFNPRWKNQIFQFNITVPSVSLFVFEVRHYDPMGSYFLAGSSVPVSALRPGVRWISLFNSNLHQVKCCGLLTRVTLKNKPIHE